MKPKKLIRENMTSLLKEGEWEEITDQKELNKLYAIKVREELAEIQESGHEDIEEFADLLQVVVNFAESNGFTTKRVMYCLLQKSFHKGEFKKIALNNLNPNNPSNKLYFEK